MSDKNLIDIQQLVRAMPIGEQVVDAILKLVRSARPNDDAPDIINAFVDWAPGPRASQTLMLAVRAKALLDGRSAPSIDDVVDLAVPVLKHRMALNYRAQAEGFTKSDLITQLCETL